uniref:Uncharacterized protein n=1 Tax=Romanomermis culicivorax TaxID=13658 RepID=A0A915KUL9_ROMCU
MGTVEESQHEMKYHSRRKETVRQWQQPKNRSIRRNKAVGESKLPENQDGRRIEIERAMLSLDITVCAEKLMKAIHNFVGTIVRMKTHILNAFSKPTLPKHQISDNRYE